MSGLNDVAPTEFDLSRQEDVYFSVSAFKFILLSIATLGIYQMYWSYKNWCLIKASKSLKIMPFWRAVFTPLWVFSLFNYMYESAHKKGIRTEIPHVALSVSCFVFYMLSNLPDPYWLLTNLSIIPMLLVNATITKVNEGHESFRQNSEVKAWQWALAVVGVSFNLLISFITAVEFDVEEFTFRYVLEKDLVEKCDNENECISAVNSQVKPCMEKSNWRNFVNNQDSDSETGRFTKEFYACIVDKDGDPYFQVD